MSKVKVEILQQRVSGKKIYIEADIIIGQTVERKSFTLEKNTNNEDAREYIIEKLKEEKKLRERQGLQSFEVEI